MQQPFPLTTRAGRAPRASYTAGMCIICVDLAKKTLKSHEARRHLGEMRETLGEHAREVETRISEAQRDEKDAEA